jgi:hypothetical protein
MRIHGEEILSLSLGTKNLEISLKLFSESNELLVQIDKNEWITGDPLPWDIEANWQTLALRERAHKISISLDAKNPPENWGTVLVLQQKGFRRQRPNKN